MQLYTYLQDGASPQARAVLSLIQGKTREAAECHGQPTVTVCRLQDGYAIELVAFEDTCTITIYEGPEHSRRDIRVAVMPPPPNQDPRGRYAFPHGYIDEVASWISELMIQFWETRGMADAKVVRA